MESIDKNFILSTAKETFQIEYETLKGLSAQLDNRFVDCVEHIFKNKGRVVTSGVGKSALVAQKIAATLNSTGTPSMFMHASDAVHGDLGMITKEDIVLCISKSGETQEIRVLIPLLKHMGVFVIAMISEEKSSLAKQADICLFVPVAKEADPNNLAPTASAIAQMAMGDALAISLLRLRGFTVQHFAKFHPGGSIGKQLFLRVKDLYPQNERPCVSSKSTMRETILEISSKRLGCTIIEDEDSGKMLGIVTDGDLRRLMEKHSDISHFSAGDILNPNPRTITPDALAIEALDEMRNNSITQLIVVENEKYIGVIHIHDLLKEGFV
jgi:arabinose-5-phosphate isomerase